MREEVGGGGGGRGIHAFHPSDTLEGQHTHLVVVSGYFDLYFDAVGEEEKKGGKGGKGGGKREEGGKTKSVERYLIVVQTGRRAPIPSTSESFIICGVWFTILVYLSTYVHVFLFPSGEPV